MSTLPFTPRMSQTHHRVAITLPIFPFLIFFYLLKILQNSAMQLSKFISLVDQCTCKEKQVFFRKISEYKLQKDLLAPGCLSACVIAENGWLRLHHTALRCVVLQECKFCCVVLCFLVLCSATVHCNPFFCIAYSSISFIYCIYLLHIYLLHCIWIATSVPQPLTRFPRAIRSLPPMAR